MNTHTITVTRHRDPTHVEHAKPHHHSKSAKAATDPQERHAQVVEQARKWVAQTFYGQLLKQMRESPFKVAKFDGGRAGEAYGSMFDQQLADRMAKGIGHKLVDSLVSRMEGKKAYDKAVRPTLPANFFGGPS